MCQILQVAFLNDAMKSIWKWVSRVVSAEIDSQDYAKECPSLRIEFQDLDILLNSREERWENFEPCKFKIFLNI